MIDSTKLSENWGWDTTSTPGVVKRKTTGTTTSDNGKTSITRTPTEETTYTLPTGGGTVDNTSGFQFPKEWEQAGDVWSQMASGNYSNTGMDWLKNLMQSGGSPVDVNAWGAAQRPAMMDQYSNMVKEMAEQAGVGGARYGSGLQNSIANYGGQLQNKYMADLADKWLQSQEAGMGRAYGAGQGLSQLGLGAQQTGAEGLLGLGQNYAQLPMQVANQMAGLGQGLTNQQIDPWTQMLASLLGPTSQATAQTYTPSTLQSLLSSLSQTLPGAFAGGGGGGGATLSTVPGASIW